MAFINNQLPKNKGNWLNDKPGFMLTCDTVSGSLEGCPDINLSSDWRSQKLSFFFYFLALAGKTCRNITFWHSRACEWLFPVKAF